MTIDAVSAVLQWQGLGFAYPGQRPLFSQWSGAVGAGVTLVHGDTGSGKSTLLRIWAGRMPARGVLSVAGTRLGDDPQGYRHALFHADAHTTEHDALTARQCTSQLSDTDPDFDFAGWQELVRGFALAPHLDKAMYMLSNGSRRKVWLAAALACGRRVILLDEPSAALDLPSVACLAAALNAPRPGRAVIVASTEGAPRFRPVATIALPPPFEREAPIG